ncbi:Detected protein of confused Function [Hibiscus syriacus]|uniref:Detected protein of confused Function n=2 Tax=Hibiscus syriacus TaxID=106335 RepID=A0A6A2YFQ7_HIBSY|nr:Detected protein of confused Function [Hibiscus syriacus]
MVSPATLDEHLLFDLPFSPLYEDSSDYNLQALMNQQNPIDESTCSSDQLVSFSGPPLTDQLENLSLYQTNHFQSLSFDPNVGNGYRSFRSLNFAAVKHEQCQMDFDSAYSTDVENAANSSEAESNSLFRPLFDSLIDSQNFPGEAASSLPENTFFAGHMRKVSSTGYLVNMRNVSGNQRSNQSTLTVEKSLMEEAPFKVGRYNPEERQERISKYRAKRNLRNFNKTIKYACRKTLADNRPRIRGRFTRNDENVETPKATWLHEVEDEIMERGAFNDSFSQYHHHHAYF